MSSYNVLYQANYPVLFKQLSTLLTSWSHLPISWFGLMQSVWPTFQKVCVFRVFPVSVPPHMLQIHQHKILQFIWGSSRPRINRVSFTHKINGGFSVPNLQAYHLAANIAPLSYLVIYVNHHLAHWAVIYIINSHYPLCPGSPPSVPSLYFGPYLAPYPSTLRPG